MADAKSLTSNKSAARLIGEIGTEMQFELPGLNNRIKLRLIGICAKDYLIYSLPKRLLIKAGLTVFKPQSSVNVRCISRGEVIGFTSSIIRAIQNPDSLLFIKFPEIIQKQAIRKNHRVKCLLPASLVKETINLTGTVADISRCGCHFQLKTDRLSPEQKNVIQVDETITIALILPGIVEENRLSGTIRNLHLDDEKVQLGIEFDQIDKQALEFFDTIIELNFELPPF